MSTNRKAGATLWTVQGILALLFLFAGGMKLVTPIGATLLTLSMGPAAGALVPFVVGTLAAFVAYGRWRVVPLRKSFATATLQPAR